MSIFSELKRRNVFRVAIAYLALAWLLTEVAGTLFPSFGIPDWGFRFVVLVLVLGFVPTLAFSWAYEITPEGLKREREVQRTESITHVTAKRLDGITIGLLVMALAFVAVDRLWITPRITLPQAGPSVQAEPSQSVEAGTADSGNEQISIAVMPFVNMSDDPDNEYFSDGVSEELLNLLARIPELRVISRSSAFSFKDKAMKISEIALQLDVTHVLEGSVRKAGDRVRITTQLIETGSDKHLWSETYDRTLNDVFAIQDEIASTVVEELKVRLLGMQGVGEKPTSRVVDPVVYDRFLQGRYFINQGSAEGYRKAIEVLNRALEQDPSYAPAWSELHRAYVNQVTNRQLGPEEALPVALEAINRAIELDPEDAVSLSRLGWFKMRFEGDLAAAARYLEQALGLEPGNGIVLANAASLLGTLGRIDQAITLEEWAMQRDPLNPTSSFNLCQAYFVGGRFEDAESMLRKTLQLSPNYLTASALMARVLYNKGEYDAAREYLEKTPQTPLRQLGEAMLHFAYGETAQFDAALDTLIHQNAPMTYPGIAFLYAFKGEYDQAFEWLQRAVGSMGPHVLVNARNAPELEEFRKDPRFDKLLTEYGLSERQLSKIRFQVALPE